MKKFSFQSPNFTKEWLSSVPSLKKVQKGCTSISQGADTVCTYMYSGPQKANIMGSFASDTAYQRSQLHSPMLGRHSSLLYYISLEF